MPRCPLSANRDFGIAAKRRLFNQLIGERDQRWWNIEAKCFRGLEIKHKLESGWLQDGQVTRFFAFKNAANINPGPST